MVKNLRTLASELSKLGFSIFPYQQQGGLGLTYNICNANIPSQDELLAMLELLTPADQIEFFDAYFPALPDDGAYCRAVVDKPGTAAYCYEGQGWHYLATAELAALLQLNWRKGDKEGKYQNYLTLKSKNYGSSRL